MEERVYQSYLRILKDELVPALGCTEPIALAYGAAIARKVFGTLPEHMDVFCSGNIIKNVKSVTVPNSGGMRGIEAAAVLGAVGGCPEKKLEVLEGVTNKDQEITRELLKKHFCTCHLEEGVENLYIRVEMTGDGHLVKVVLSEKHTRVERVEKDGEILFSCGKEETVEKKEDERALLNVKDILTFAQEVKMEDIEEVIGRQVEMNTAISEEGLKNHYGAEVGRTLLAAYGDDIKVRAKAKAAAGSDARMNGCAMPVVINSGSGNQGMTCSLPVIEYAKELKVSKEKMYRALAVSNLVAIHQKKYIGSLSAYCGAVSAACGAGAAITWLYGGDYEAVSRTITNTIANMGGVVCDGAKSSCAAKIASSVDAAIMAYMLENADHCFKPGEGLVQDDVEDTIRNMGYVGRVGMKSTDVTILKLMIAQEKEADAK
ncbi:serine dehydratase subunit alpha family protein [Parablautia intestinalis]|uniref:UPF0597 protein D7V94_07240 n=1 Tax=Parablautia intestinalis TaxID=2320100 RepID=A0A3A9AN50_9FIRM|nr:L-serine ammonia-lyase, iron-sulfur-dependent, subunit alpha [Parablautia intestinalis]RKI92454.1 serine dehydratase subunit alpha family protein [Parablautia intestinalis]